jgi:hypothetical protein
MPSSLTIAALRFLSGAQDIPFPVAAVQSYGTQPDAFCRLVTAPAHQRSQAKRYHRNACNEQAHRCEGSKITNEISHNLSPFRCCSLSVPFLFNSQARAHTTPAIQCLWLMQPIGDRLTTCAKSALNGERQIDRLEGRDLLIKDWRDEIGEKACRAE